MVYFGWTCYGYPERELLSTVCQRDDALLNSRHFLDGRPRQNSRAPVLLYVHRLTTGGINCLSVECQAVCPSFDRQMPTEVGRSGPHLDPRRLAWGRKKGGRGAFGLDSSGQWWTAQHFGEGRSPGDCRRVLLAGTGGSGHEAQIIEMHVPAPLTNPFPDLNQR